MPVNLTLSAKNHRSGLGRHDPPGHRTQGPPRRPSQPGGDLGLCSNYSVLVRFLKGEPRGVLPRPGSAAGGPSPPCPLPAGSPLSVTTSDGTPVDVPPAGGFSLWQEVWPRVSAPRGALHGFSSLAGGLGALPPVSKWAGGRGTKPSAYRDCADRKTSPTLNSYTVFQLVESLLPALYTPAGHSYSVRNPRWS